MCTNPVNSKADTEKQRNDFRTLFLIVFVILKL